MLGFIADSLNAVTSVLFPVYASYKALRTSDPAQLTPWLMYWTTVSLFLASESLFNPVLRWIPLYSWLRLGLHLYLVLPGQQGSVYLYRHYLHPFLDRHERDVDHFIGTSHERAKAAGLDYCKQAIEYVKVHLLHLPPKAPSPPPSRNVSYSQALLSRFAMPAARTASGVAATGDVLGLLGNAVHQIVTSNSKSREARAEELSASNALVPADISGEERSTFILTQQDRLMTLLRAYEKEADAVSVKTAAPDTSAPTSPTSLQKSTSEAEFVDVSREKVPDGESIRPEIARQASQKTWGGWMWGSPKDKDAASPPTPDKKSQ